MGKYKVAWKYVCGKISGKGDFRVVMIVPINDSVLGEGIPILDERLMFVSTNNSDEAHYLTAVMNSTHSRLLVASYTIETQISTHVLEYLGIPRYNRKENNHRRLVELAKEAQKVKADIATGGESTENDLRTLDDAIDDVVSEAYGITEDEEIEIARAYEMLKPTAEAEEVDDDLEKED